MEPSTAVSPPRKRTVSGIARALRVFDAFDAGHCELRLSEIARRARLPLSTTHRIVGEFLAWGGLERTGDHYRIGLRIFELGTIAPTWEQRKTAALPFMQDLYEATHESVHLGVLDGTEIVYLLKINGHTPFSADTRTGGRHAAYCTSLGKAILAFSPAEVQQMVVDTGLKPATPHAITTPAAFYEEMRRIRQMGVAFDRQESGAGVGCVGAPIFSADRTPIAAVSVTGPIRRINLCGLAPAVHAASLGIARALL